MNIPLLLDTSFLLPSFGVDVGKGVENCLRFLAEHRGSLRIYFSRYSILEASLILLREVRRGQLKREEAYAMAEAGASTVAYGLEAIDESPWVFREALRLYTLGHRDMFDNILYATAVDNEIHFLTLDRKLREFIKEHQLKDVTVTPEILREKYGGDRS